ncbi:MAG: hypothetical protein QM770_07340 [Tepidisphaeraceae bacterium]
MRTDIEAARQRIEATRAFVPGYIAATPTLARFGRHAALLMHGSTTFGFADACADLDVWMVTPADESELERLPTRFFEFKIDGAKGHLTLESARSMDTRVRGGDLPLIYELRHAVVFGDEGLLEDTLLLAKRPMSDAFRRARFMYYYVEMRSEHRAIDNPIDRGDSVAMLLAIGKTLERALQASIVLDGEAFPYVKWLDWASKQTPMGQAVAPHVAEVLRCLAAGVLHVAGPECDHPLTHVFKAIRSVLVTRAMECEINEPWLREWWLHIPQARAAGLVPWA